MLFNYISLNLFSCFLLLAPLNINAIKKTNCKEFEVRYYKYNEFYDLSLIKDAQSKDYYAKLPITFESNNGDIHVLFAESNNTNLNNNNRAYEFALGGWSNTLTEIRRKDEIYEKRNFNGNRFADYRVPNRPDKFHVELSVSTGGVVQMENLETHFKFNFTDQLPVIPVKYLAFAGFRGARSNVTFDCVEIETIENIISTTETVSKVATNATSEATTESKSIASIETSTKTTNPTSEAVIESNNDANEILPKVIESTTAGPIFLKLGREIKEMSGNLANFANFRKFLQIPANFRTLQEI